MKVERLRVVTLNIHKGLSHFKRRMVIHELREGLQELLAKTPRWLLLRTVYHVKKKPYVLGALMLLSGYVAAFVNRLERPVSPELVAFRRREV